MDRKTIQRICSSFKKQDKPMHTHRKQQLLVLIHIVLLLSMSVYIVKMKKILKEQEKNLSLTISPTNGITCYSTKSHKSIQEFLFYQDILLYCIIASAFYNLLYLAFFDILPKSKYIDLLFYFPLFVVGVVCLGYSTSGYIQIKSFTSEPLACQKMFNNFKLFFILSLSAGVIQAIISSIILLSSFLHITTS